METFKFKTNINCGNCVKAVTPHLNKLEGIQEWTVDTNNPNKVLEVKADSADAQEIKSTVERAGFEAELI
ncbi:heavy-metal-associated domain-containing protein [Pontibacter akesuensis]|uniref:Heavy-metal-associated domain-containing protein n=1 Tax=Pontibacter akesuensis TaxID=388950 RepID=A0A1I7KIH9_9BACT|nr:heavy-metal-associated domain-containing protein [Pontibacter akesuensis]GHA80212.1 hypothetical protein GCM10007389_37960 [Pontibacter akesuensis]SFU97212.1 Heavy-metal-associated domain-containing protein [Pontibacter akesuensis]